MAGKSKSTYVSIVDSKTHKTVLQKTFFNAVAVKEFLNSKEIQEKYPKPDYYMVKETY